MEDKKKKSWFLEKTFLLANLSMNITLKRLYFILNNIKVNFIDYNFN